MTVRDIQVRSIGPDDEPRLRQWYDIFVTASRADRSDPPIPTYEQIVAPLRPSSAMRTEAFLAYEAGQPAGVGGVQFPLLDNTRLAYALLAVLPERRRRGVGTALYERVLERARAEDRTSLLAGTKTAPDQLASAPGVAFASKHGLTVRNTEIRRELKLPVDAAKLDALAAKAAERTGSYGMASWIGAVPEEYAEQFARFKGLLDADAPSGDMDVEPQKWDVARLREEEARDAAAGSFPYTTVGIAPDGRLAGYTRIWIDTEPGERVDQGGTFVLDSHRGHRLGLAMKVANLRAFQLAYPGVRRISTENAEQNAPMVNVNVELGFEIVEYSQSWQGAI